MALSDETGIVSALTWLVSRHGRYGRAVVLHDRLQQRKAAGEWSVGRLDAARLRAWTVRVAMRWTSFVRRLGRDIARGRGTTRLEPVVGLLAAPFALPAAALVAVAAVLAILVVAVVHAAVWTLCAAGRSVRSIVHRPPREPVARSFDMRAS